MPINVGYHVCPEGVVPLTCKFCKKKPVCIEAKSHIHLICCDGNFENLHINVVIFVPRKHSKNDQFVLY